MIKYSAFLVVLTIAFFANPAHAATRDEQHSDNTIEIMILGSNHFTGGGPDTVDPDVPYYLGARGQQEIADLLDRLEAYAPDKIMVELDFELEGKFNERYDAFLEGTHKLTVNERQQIGMRLAQRLGHKKLYAIDFESFLDYGPAIAAAKELGQTQLLKVIDDLSDKIKASYEDDAKLPLIERLIAMNSTEQNLQRKTFLTIAQLGTAEDPQGALQILTWWQRNLVMFARTAQQAAPGDKLLIVIGNGHRDILQEFFGDAPGFKLVSPVPYLER